MFRFRRFSSPYSLIQSKYGKIQSRETLNTDTSFAVIDYVYYYNRSFANSLQSLFIRSENRALLREEEIKREILAFCEKIELQFIILP